MVVEIEFDSEKDQANIVKHGMSLELAAMLFENEYKEKPDNRRDYGETRMIAIGPIAGRFYVCVYTWRKDIRRIISLRKANRGEINGYYKG